MTESHKSSIKMAIFAGGCFWCIEPPFTEIEGVLSVVPGYTGGTQVNPTYEQVISGKTGHVEAVQIQYDENKVSYKELLDIFWCQIDPTDPEGQFADKGSQYKTVIFFHDKVQQKIAEASKDALTKANIFKKPIETLILQAKPFYEAEAYHQEYYKKNPLNYQSYKYHSGREVFINETWKKNKTF
jgi:peptide methionine sulfoxide reductase msrA/msrB